MCAVNCASEGAANSSDIKIMPFNNYGINNPYIL